jgi:ribosomal protein L17
MKRAVTKEVIPTTKPKLARVKPAVAKVEEKAKVEETEPIVEEPIVKTKPLPKEIELIPIRPKLKYQLKTGKLRIFKTNFKAGDTFLAYPEEIPEGFKKDVVCVSDPELQKEVAAALLHIAGKETLYEIKVSKSAGWFNVINVGTGKQINEKALKAEDAAKLCKSLNV